MIKSLIISLLVTVLFVGVYAFDLFDILSHAWFFYVAVVLLVGTLTAAGIILGNPLGKDKHDGSDD
jgi:hypothetical protein